MILETVPPSLRGNLGKWLLEIKSGCFVGKVNALVRERLWERCLQHSRGGAVIQIWSAPNEQGFEIRCDNLKGRELADYDGINLIRILRTENNDI
jgi:CRISPR-associated protein Cas2